MTCQMERSLKIWPAKMRGTTGLDDLYDGEIQPENKFSIRTFFLAISFSAFVDGVSNKR